MLTHTPADYPEMPDEAEKPGRGFESGGNHTEYQDAWSFGLKAKPREANQRPAPMTLCLLHRVLLFRVSDLGALLPTKEST